MAGEFKIARASIEQAVDAANADAGMSIDVMESALLNVLLEQMSTTRSRKDLASLINFQMESVGEDEFVVTRGC